MRSVSKTTHKLHICYGGQRANFESFRISFAIFAIFCLKRLNLQNITNMAHGVAYFEGYCFKTAPTYIT